MDELEKIEVKVMQRGVDDAYGLELQEKIDAGWDADDPGVGKAILTPDGREVFNPVPVAPPIGYVPQEDMMSIMHRMVQRELATLRDAEEVDTAEEADDFGEDEEEEYLSPYEVVMMEEFPAPPPVSAEDVGKPQVPESFSNNPDASVKGAPKEES